LKKIWKIIWALTGMLLVLGFALAVLAQTLITPERVKALLLPMSEQVLQRRILLENVEVGLFSGIVLKDVRVMERSGEIPFLMAERMVLRFRLWPLLLRQVVVDEITLVAPRITLIRRADGSFNCSDLVARDLALDNGQAQFFSGEDSGAPIPIELLIANVGIRGGEIQFIDQRFNSESPFMYKISDVRIELGEITSSRACPFTLQAQLSGTSLDFAGEARLNPWTGWIRMRLGELDLVPFSPYFRQYLPGKLGVLKVTLDLTITGDGQNLTSSGRITVPAIDLALNDWPESPVQNARASLDYDLKVNPSTAVLRLAKVDADLNGIRVNLSGLVENYVAAPQLDLLLILPGLDLREAMTALPKGLMKTVADLDPAGQLTARFHLHGTPGHSWLRAQRGELRLTDVQFSTGGLRPSLTGLVTLDGDQASGEKLKLVLGDNVAEVSFKAGNLFGRPLTLSSTINSEQFLLDPLFSFDAGEDPDLDENSSAAPDHTEKAEIGPFELPIEADGEMRIARTGYRGLAIEQFFLRYRLLDNLLTVETLTGKVATGSFQKTASIDLGKKGLAYQGQLDLRAIPADSLMKAFAPKASGTVFGDLSLRADFSGKGTLSETLRRNLTSRGEFSIAEGRLTASPLVKGVADFVRHEALNEVSFDRVLGEYQLKNGEILLNGDLSGRDVTMKPSGTVDLDGQLDLKLGTRLSPQLIARLDENGEVARLFTDSSGWGELPLLVTGSLGKPRFTFDPAVIKSKAKDQLRRKLEEKVAAESTEPAKQLLEETLKGLFYK